MGFFLRFAGSILIRKLQTNQFFLLRIRHRITGDHLSKHVDFCLHGGLVGIAPVDRSAGSNVCMGHDASLPSLRI